MRLASFLCWHVAEAQAAEAEAAAALNEWGWIRGSTIDLDAPSTTTVSASSPARMVRFGRPRAGPR
jgi:hypothetical protein